LRLSCATCQAGSSRFLPSGFQEVAGGAIAAISRSRPRGHFARGAIRPRQSGLFPSNRPSTCGGRPTDDKNHRALARRISVGRYAAPQPSPSCTSALDLRACWRMFQPDSKRPWVAGHILPGVPTAAACVRYRPANRPRRQAGFKCVKHWQAKNRAFCAGKHYCAPWSNCMCVPRVGRTRPPMPRTLIKQNGARHCILCMSSLAQAQTCDAMHDDLTMGTCQTLACSKECAGCFA